MKSEKSKGRAESATRSSRLASCREKRERSQWRPSCTPSLHEAATRTRRSCLPILPCRAQILSETAEQPGCAGSRRSVLESRNLHLVELPRITARTFATRVHCQARNSSRGIGRVSWVAGIHERRRYRLRRSAPGRSEGDLRNVDSVSNKRPTQLDLSPPFYFSLFTFYFSLSTFYFLLSTFYFHISSPPPRCACGVCSARSAAGTSCMGCTRREDSRFC